MSAQETNRSVAASNRRCLGKVPAELTFQPAIEREMVEIRLLRNRVSAQQFIQARGIRRCERPIREPRDEAAQFEVIARLHAPPSAASVCRTQFSSVSRSRYKVCEIAPSDFPCAAANRCTEPPGA